MMRFTEFLDSDQLDEIAIKPSTARIFAIALKDIVQAARFILTTPSLNAQVITIDGGQHLQKLPRDVAFLESTRDK